MGAGVRGTEDSGLGIITVNKGIIKILKGREGRYRWWYPVRGSRGWSRQGGLSR